MADVALRFNELRTLLEHCDKATLVQETFGLYPVSPSNNDANLHV